MDTCAFWSRVSKPDTGCWLWAGKTNEYGYGRLEYGGDKWYAHRLSYTLTFGPIPEGMLVLHRCDTPACIRPDHLFLGTQADNVRDMIAKGRQIITPRKTHCKRGHPFTPENTLFHTKGHRRCRECENAPRRKGGHRFKRQEPLCSLTPK